MLLTLVSGFRHWQRGRAGRSQEHVYCPIASSHATLNKVSCVLQQQISVVYSTLISLHDPIFH